MLFKKIGLAITFSPTGKALLKEAKRLSDLFQAEIILIHIGEKSAETERRLLDLIESTGLNLQTTKVEWESGDVVPTIIKKVNENNIDLLVAGALEKENLLGYYIGSVARKLMREAPCSILILTEPSEVPKGFKNFCVSVDYTPLGESTIKAAYQFAILERAELLTLIKEFQIPGLAMSVYNTGSMREIVEIRLQFEREEKDKVDMLAKELQIQRVPYKIVCLYGKEGYEVNNYITKIDGDIYFVSSPQKRLKFVDRIFQHDLEFTIRQLPCPVLIIRNNKLDK